MVVYTKVNIRKNCKFPSDCKFQEETTNHNARWTVKMMEKRTKVFWFVLWFCVRVTNVNCSIDSSRRIRLEHRVRTAKKEFGIETIVEFLPPQAGRSREISNFNDFLRAVSMCNSLLRNSKRDLSVDKRREAGKTRPRVASIYIFGLLAGWLAGRPNVARVLDFRAGIKRSGKLDAKWSRA